MAFVNYGAEWTAYKALSAGYAKIVVYIGAAVFVGFYRMHAAGLGTGAFLADDRIVRACLHTFAAVDAFVGIDMRLSVLYRDGTLGAYHRTGVL